MRPLKDLFMHELLSTGSSPEPPTPPVPSGNVITGRFKAETSGRLKLQLPIPSGSYGKAIYIFPTEGLIPGSSLYAVNKNNFIVQYGMFKEYMNLAPVYAGENADQCTVLYEYTLIGGTFSSGYTNQRISYNRFGPSTILQGCIVFSADNEIELYTKTSTDSSSAVGFMVGVDYTYVVCY